MADEKTPPVEETTPSVEETGEETPKEKGPVPYERFQEVIDDKNQFKSDLETLTKEVQGLKDLKTPEEEPADWKEAETRTVDKAVTKIKGEMKVEADAEVAREEAIEKGFDQIKGLGQEITPEIRKATLEHMVKSGEDVYDSFLKVKQRSIKSEQLKTPKGEGFVPPQSKGTEGPGSDLSYKEIRSKSLDDLMEEGSQK